MNLYIITHFEKQPIALIIIGILLFMSFISWYIILRKAFALWWIDWQGQSYQRTFWQENSLKSFMQKTQALKNPHPFAYLALNMVFTLLDYKNYIKNKNPAHTNPHQDVFIDKTKVNILSEQKDKMYSGLTLLASIGSIAPFVGLLGTVISIYSALMQISQAGNASLQVVAAPIGEALILTAIGLAVAIPAVFGYNLILRGQKLLLGRMDRFAYYLASYLYTGKKPTLIK